MGFDFSPSFGHEFVQESHRFFCLLLLEVGLSRLSLLLYCTSKLELSWLALFYSSTIYYEYSSTSTTRSYCMGLGQYCSAVLYLCTCISVSFLQYVLLPTVAQ